MVWKNVLYVSIVIILLFGVGVLFFFLISKHTNQLLSPGGLNLAPQPTPKPLLSLSFTNLAKRSYLGSSIKLGDAIKRYDGFTSHLFTYTSDGYTISGLANLPLSPLSHKFPVIIMIRGYVDQKEYQTGMGTSRAAEVFAKNGYITLAPDFLGYGQSDRAPSKLNDNLAEWGIWWQRFHNPIEVLNLIASVKSIGMADPQKIGIWAHSNGGQIALSILEISQNDYPTTLWAPVSKPFPYSALFYTDEFADEGKYLRKQLAKLETDYDVNDFSITNYFGQIKAPLQIQQGTADPEVPLDWSNDLVAKLKALSCEVTYITVPGADHNMVSSWDKAVANDLDFFNKHLQ